MLTNFDLTHTLCPEEPKQYPILSFKTRNFDLTLKFCPKNPKMLTMNWFFKLISTTCPSDNHDYWQSDDLLSFPPHLPNGILINDAMMYRKPEKNDQKREKKNENFCNKVVKNDDNKWAMSRDDGIWRMRRRRLRLLNPIGG